VIIIPVNHQSISNHQSAISKSHASLAFPMRRVFATEAAELRELQPLRRLLLVLRRAVIAPLTFLASERDDVPHGVSLRLLIADC
jgi:hypothetical protein